METYPRAPPPALALGYKAPGRDSDVYCALGLIDQALAQGRASRLYRALVQEHGFTGDVSASMNSLGNMFNVEGPTLHTISLFHDAATRPDTIVDVVDREIERFSGSRSTRPRSCWRERRCDVALRCAGGLLRLRPCGPARLPSPCSSTIPAASTASRTDRCGGHRRRRRPSGDRRPAQTIRSHHQVDRGADARCRGSPAAVTAIARRPGRAGIQPGGDMDILGIRLVGVTAESGHKLLLTLLCIAGVLLLRAAVVGVAYVATGRHRNERVMFWTRQGASVTAALLGVIALLSIWFDDPRRLTTGLGVFSAGLAFALQRVVTALAGYVVIMRGNTFTVGDRITMGGVRGDVIALTFTQTKIMEMGQPPAVQGADPAMWVRSRQFTGRIVTVTNDKVFDEPVYNYTREFPFIWEEISVPVAYRADRERAEAILLASVAAETEALDDTSEPVRTALERRYFLSLEELTPRVFYRLTDNWLELSVRFIVRAHGVRDVKDAISRRVLREFDNAGLGVASATYEIVGLPPVRLERGR